MTLPGLDRLSPLSPAAVHRQHLPRALRLVSDPRAPLQIHLVLQGEMEIRAPFTLRAALGDVVLTRGLRPLHLTNPSVERIDLPATLTASYHPLQLPAFDGLCATPAVTHIQAVHPTDHAARSLSEALLREALSPSNGSTILIPRLFDALLVAVLRQAPVDEHRLSHVIDAYRRTMHEPWTVGRMAKAAGMSRAAFARAFAAWTGTTPASHLTSLRMQAAQRLLTTTTEPIQEIATRVGYQSLSSFSQLFKRTFGVAPARYRQMSLTPPSCLHLVRAAA